MTPLLDCVVDLSVFQGEIDAEKMAEAGILLAMVKASQGDDHVDSRYESHVTACRGAGIRVIPYHFLTTTPWDAQIKLFRSTAEAPIMALDWERTIPDDSRSALPAGDVEKCGNTLFAAGLRVLGYWGYRSAAPATPTPAMRNWDRWIPRYPWGDLPRFAGFGAVLPEVVRPTDPTLKFWQYTDAGRVAGITGRVDRSVANFASTEELLRWLGP